MKHVSSLIGQTAWGLTEFTRSIKLGDASPFHVTRPSPIKFNSRPPGKAVKKAMTDRVANIVRKHEDDETGTNETCWLNMYQRFCNSRLFRASFQGNTKFSTKHFTPTAEFHSLPYFYMTWWVRSIKLPWHVMREGYQVTRRVLWIRIVIEGVVGISLIIYSYFIRKVEWIVWKMTCVR